MIYLAKAFFLSCAIFLLLPTAGFAIEPMNYIGFYQDMNRNHLDWHIDFPYTTTDIYTWIYTGPDGMMCAEYKALSSTYCILFGVEYNPDILSYTGSPYGSPGIELCFGTCQEGWVFVNKSTVRAIELSIPPCEILVTAAPHDGTGKLEITNCEESSDIKELGLLDIGEINCYPLGVLVFPEILQVDVIDSMTLDIEYPYVEYPIYDVIFSLYNEDDRSDSIIVDRFHPAVNPSVMSRLDLESPLVDETTYILAGYGCGLNLGCMVSWQRFIYNSSVATLLYSFEVSYEDNAIQIIWQLSDIDEDAEFIILRSENGGNFIQLSSEYIETFNLNFNFIDDKIEQGLRYSYKVDYLSEDSRNTLFITESVETPTMPVTLKNYPNPFNPSTDIVYYLPQMGQVTIGIYDVSGKCVRHLIEKVQNRGEHSIAWDGKSDTGISQSSGVFFCRLRSGKKNSYHKMILLR